MNVQARIDELQAANIQADSSAATTDSERLEALQAEERHLHKVYRRSRNRSDYRAYRKVRNQARELHKALHGEWFEKATNQREAELTARGVNGYA